MTLLSAPLWTLCLLCSAFLSSTGHRAAVSSDFAVLFLSKASTGDQLLWGREGTEGRAKCTRGRQEQEQQRSRGKLCAHRWQSKRVPCPACASGTPSAERANLAACGHGKGERQVLREKCTVCQAEFTAGGFEKIKYKKVQEK